MLASFRRTDPSADTVEDSFQDARIRATLDGQPLEVYLAAPGLTPPGTILGSDPAVSATRVRTSSFGTIWRFACEVPDYGIRTVDVAYASDPAGAIKAVRRTVGCL